MLEENCDWSRRLIPPDRHVLNGRQAGLGLSPEDKGLENMLRSHPQALYIALGIALSSGLCIDTAETPSFIAAPVFRQRPDLVRFEDN